MDKVVTTLFLPIQQSLSEDIKRMGFLNAYPHPDLSFYEMQLQQYFKPYASALEQQGLSVQPEIEAIEGDLDAVLILLPKNIDEAKYIIAKGLTLLKPQGTLFCAASNKAGGNRIKKILQDFGLIDLQDLSKNKARVVWGKLESLIPNIMDKALEQGQKQFILDGEYQSQPGVFGWNKIDQGSQILLQNLPENLRGKGADFGCGFGYLSKNILQQHQKIEELICIDADFRAVKLCEENLKTLEKSAKIKFLWQDLTQDFSAPKDLDFIIMNPPFHEGKKTDSDIGKSFIQSAFQALKLNGKLYFVANINLPYEQVLRGMFTRYETLYTGQGFKVFCAQK